MFASKENSVREHFRILHDEEYKEKFENNFTISKTGIMGCDVVNSGWSLRVLELKNQSALLLLVVCLSHTVTMKMEVIPSSESR
jgi:hypothetical protein